LRRDDAGVHAARSDGGDGGRVRHAGPSGGRAPGRVPGGGPPRGGVRRVAAAERPVPRAAGDGGRGGGHAAGHARPLTASASWTRRARLLHRGAGRGASGRAERPRAGRVDMGLRETAAKPLRRPARRGGAGIFRPAVSSPPKPPHVKARVDVVMPTMGEPVIEGTVLEWQKQVGDVVAPDETLLEISTDKVDSEVPAPSGGRLVEILVQEGDTVDVGTPIAVIETDVDAPVAAGGGAEGPDDEAAAPTEEVSEAAPAEVPAEQEVQPAEAVPTEAARGADELPTGEGMATSGSALGNRVEVVMPKMGESVMEGTVLSWAKAVGDEV